MGPAKNGTPDRNRFVLGVDLDGVCADFYGSLRAIAAEWLDVPVQMLTDDVSFGLDEWDLESMGGYEALHRFAVTQRQLFARMEPISGAAAALRRLSAHDVRIRIITHRLFIKHFHREAVSQTIEWLDRHGIPYWDLCLMESKADVGADLYVEDSPRHVQALRDKGLPTIVFTNSTNVHLPGPRADGWAEVERLVREAVVDWRAKQLVAPALARSAS